MSITTFGIPLPFGQTLRPKNTTECPYHCSATPDNFTLNYLEENLNLHIDNIRNKENEFDDVGISVIQNPFIDFKVDRIYSNVKLANILDATSVIQSSELNAYLSIDGTMDLLNVSLGMKEFESKVFTMINSYIWKLQEISGDKNIGTSSTIDFLGENTTNKHIIYNAFLKCLQATYSSFLSVSSKNSLFDFSVYTNILNATISSMSTTLTNYKLTNRIDSSLNIDINFRQLDPSFYAFYKGDEETSKQVSNIVSICYGVLLEKYKKSNSFFGLLKTLDSKVKSSMKNKYDDVEIPTFIFGRLAALLQLAYILTSVEIKGPTSSSNLILLFALPQKFIYV